MKRLLLLGLLALAFFALAAPALAVPAQTYTLTGMGAGMSGGISSLDFLDADHGWIGGGTGTIKVTSDGGATWQTQTSGATSAIFDIEFVDLNHGWACTTLGTVLHTSNGGATWDQKTLPGTTRFVTDIEGVAGGDVAWALSDGYAYRTVNAGGNWERNTAVGAFAYPRLDFVDADHGWLVGQGIKATSDGGDTWTEQNSFWGITSICMLDLLHGYAVGQGAYNAGSFKTGDGGATWTATDRVFVDPVAIKYTDVDRGWQVTKDGRVRATEDGGQTWVEQTTPWGYAATGIEVVGDRTWVYGAGDQVLFCDHNGSADLHAPTTEIVGTPIATAPITVTLQATDNAGGSGVAATYYQIDGGTWKTWDPALPIVLQPRSDPGNLNWYRVNVYSTDAYGNVETAHSSDFCVDVWAPVTTLTPASKWQLDYWNHTASKVTLNATDTGPAHDIRSIKVSRDKGVTWTTMWPGSVVLTPAPADHSNDGVHPLWVRASDTAGNVEEVKKHAVSIDTRKPTAGAPSSASVRRGGTARLKARINDRQPCAGVGKVAVVITNLSGTRRYKVVAPAKWFAVNATFTVSFTCKLPKGSYRFWVWAGDAAANQSAKAARNTLVVR